MLYTINYDRLTDLNKKFNRYNNKLNKVGMNATLEVGEKYQKKVNVYAYDDIEHCERKIGTAIIDVVDVKLNFPEYKLGNYEVCAVIEHGENNTNMVYPVNNNITIPTKYFKVKGICEHCNTNHRRVKTVVLKDVHTEEFKQVGTACLKEYTGVDELGIISAYKAIDSFLEETVNYKLTDFPTRVYRDTNEYLAKCIHMYNHVGYNKSNKYKVDEKYTESDITESDRLKAEEVINFFNSIDIDTLMNEGFGYFAVDTKNAVTKPYCKLNCGFVAYSIVLYEQIKTYFDNKAAEEYEKSKISFYGNVNDKIKNIHVTGRCVSCSESQWGICYIYRFTNSDNNVFIWTTSKSIECDADGLVTGTISGTIKEHSEYRNEKQTVLTRCKVVAE